MQGNIQEVSVNPPQMTKQEKFNAIIRWTVFFPIGLLKSTCTFLLGGLVGKLILPSWLLKEDKQSMNELKAKFFQQNDEKVSKKNFFISTSKTYKLDTVEIVPKNFNGGKKELLHVINFVGNGECYEPYLEELTENSSKNNIVNIGFNYPGVIDSTGYASSKNDLINAGIAQVQRLLDEGVPADKIVLFGHSIGGGVATLVTKHFHELGIKINIFNDRSFDTIGDFISGKIRDASEKSNFIIRWALLRPIALISWLIIKPIVYITGWEMNAGDAYNSLPEENKDYLSVRFSKNYRQNGSIGDGVIPDSDSIHSAQKAIRHFRKELLDEAIKLKKEGKNEELEKLMKQIEVVFKGTKFEELSKDLKKFDELREMVKYEHKLYTTFHPTQLPLHNMQLNWARIQFYKKLAKCLEEELKKNPKNIDDKNELNLLNANIRDYNLGKKELDKPILIQRNFNTAANCLFENFLKRVVSLPKTQLVQQPSLHIG